MPEDTTSPEYTVTIKAGTADVLRACVTRIDEVIAEAERDVQDYADLARTRQEALEETRSLLRGLYQVLLSNAHDGDVSIFPDGERSFFFRYASGYHGGLINHVGQAGSRWSIHT